MCRWFAYISPTESCLLDDILVAPPNALIKQVNEHYLPELIGRPSPHAPGVLPLEPEAESLNNSLNADGFGIVWYTPTFTEFSPPPRTDTPKPHLHPALYKTIQPPFNETYFRSICMNTSSKVVLAHIRATVGTGVVSNNNHPFTFGIHSFMHNGWISDFQKVKRRMIEHMSHEAYANVQGSTDTEHFAALFMTYLCPNTTATSPNPNDTPLAESSIPASWEAFHTAKELDTALRKTIKKIIDLQIEILGGDAHSNLLNIAVTDSKSLVACRFRNHSSMQPLSLYYSTTAGPTLDRRYPDHPRGAKGPYGHHPGKLGEGYNPHARKKREEHGKHLIIASEPSTYKTEEWTSVGRNHVITSEDGNVLGIEPFEYFNVPGHAH